jgi:cell division protein FtsQ
MTDPGPRRWRLVRAPSAAVPPSVRKFHARARARRLRSARPLLAIGAVLAVVGGLVYVGLGTSLVGAGQVDVHGAGFVSAEQIRAAAAVRSGTPLLRLDTRAVAHRVETLVGVARADVSRRLPGTVVIDVRLRTPVAAVPTGTAYRLVDASGVAFRTVSELPPGVTVVDIRTPAPDDPSTRGALAVLAALPAALRGQLSHIDAVTPVEITLVLTGGRQIIWGDATDNATKARVALSLLPRRDTVIDVSAPNVATIR